MPRKPRLVGGVKGHNIKEITLPGSPALCLAAGRQGRGASIQFLQEDPMFEVSEKATEMIKEAIRNQGKIPSIRVVFNEDG